MNTIDETVTTGEAAKMMGVSTQKVARYRREGKLQGQRVGNTNVFVFRVSDLRKIDWSQQKTGRKSTK